MARLGRGLTTRMTDLPVKSHRYINHPIINSDRWDGFQHRQGDIIISTSYKAGTTWTQTIVANLLYQDGQFPAPVNVMSPWLDQDVRPVADVIADLGAQIGRRFIKTHLPLDGLPYFDTATYVVVGRDPRDVFMSMWNHHSGYTDETSAIMRQKAAACGHQFPMDQVDIHAFWEDWINRSYFEWESDGFPYWSHLHHAQSWWDYRHLNNIELFHYGDMLSDPEREIRRLAGYLDVEIDEEKLPGIVKRTSFDDMKANFDNIMPEAKMVWKGGGDTFMNKGTNGRWRNVLTEQELSRYSEVVGSTLSPDCATWLENGFH